MNKTVSAEIAQRHLTAPDGEIERCWVVTAIEEGGMARAIFTGFEASARATAYARARYAPCHFRMMAEPGEYATTIAQPIAADAH